MCGCMKKSMTAMTSAQAQAVVDQAPKTETDQHAPEPAYANASAE